MASKISAKPSADVTVKFVFWLKLEATARDSTAKPNRVDSPARAADVGDMAEEQISLTV